MKESDYITATNLARLRVIADILRSMIPNKNLPAKSIGRFEKWAHLMVDRHHALIDKAMGGGE